jgi:hypothetical protein
VKHVQKKKRKSTSFGNVADEINDIFSMVNKDTFVKEVVYPQGNNKPPSVIYYSGNEESPFLNTAITYELVSSSSDI